MNITVYKINEKEYTAVSQEQLGNKTIIHLQVIRNPDIKIGRPQQYTCHCARHAVYTRQCPKCKALRNIPEFKYQVEDNILQD